MVLWISHFINAVSKIALFLLINKYDVKWFNLYTPDLFWQLCPQIFWRILSIHSIFLIITKQETLRKNTSII